MYSKLSETNMASAPTGIVAFKINGVGFEFDSTKKTMRDVINEVNSSAAGVTLSYSEATDKFTISSKVKGAGEAIRIEEMTGGFFGDGGKLGINSLTIDNGQDAVFELDRTAMTRNSNSFVIDGVSYSLMKENVTVSVNVEQNVDEVFNNIKNFVDKYNELIEKINTEIREERDSDYIPLTDEQKEAMSEKEVEKWEEKAKAGTLRNDSILTGMLNEMRNAIYNSIDGIDGGVYSIGIKTGTYTQKGKLVIDETKLKDAIKNTPDLVESIFSKESDINYSVNMSSEDRQTRYKENGIVQRLHDIIQKNITTVPNTEGSRVLLVERAGSTGDYFDTTSYISSQINQKDDLIDLLTEKLYDKEDQYYAKFAAMEKALSQMNSQSSWLSQQFSSGQ
jgi:flagellar hook-associated protein 2